MPHTRPAIPANKNYLGDLITYWLLVRSALWNSFDRVWVQICGRLPRRAEGPLICYMNHPSWWDGYMAAVINREVLRQRFAGYLMMEEFQLRIYRFMTWSGAFSVDRHNPREAARSVEYISQVLRQRPDQAFYIFPQGEITPNDRRPLTTYPGVAHVVRRVGAATLCPITLRYEFRSEQRPEAFIRFGPCHRATTPVHVAALTEEVNARLTASSDALRDAVIADDMGSFGLLLHGRPGIDRFFDPLFGLLTGQRREPKA
jgi:1-acyl-sn-glycerol-3-phosphate acyltransferase